jgi:Na+-transporting NADH:ubiquinone oxidoreductase subunit NqrF
MYNKDEIFNELTNKDFISSYITNVGESESMKKMLHSVREFITDKRLKITKKIQLDLSFRSGGYLVLKVKNSKGEYTQVTFMPTGSNHSDNYNLFQSIDGNKRAFLNLSYEDSIKKTAKCLELLKK